MPFLAIVADTIQWLQLRTIAGVIVAVGHIAFAINFVWILVKRRPAGVTQPTLFRNAPDLEVVR